MAGCTGWSPVSPSDTPGTAVPGISAQPQSQTIAAGGTATLTVSATGAGTLAYQWYQGSSGETAAPVAGATASSFTTPALNATGSYWVRVSNGGASADSTTATVTVTATPTESAASPPAITRHPEDQSIASGQSVSLTVRVTGTDPMAYQWYSGASGDTSAALAGATGSDFLTPVLTVTSSFWVRVSNAAGSVNSSAATVRVSSTPPSPSPAPPAAPPSITSQPAPQSVTSGQSATLVVGASGTAPLVFQWYAGSSGDTVSPVAGATSSTFPTPPLTATTSYWVRVSNSAGSVNSASATVTVAAPPLSGSPSFEDQVIALVNQFRASGATCGGVSRPPVPALAFDLNLRQAARGHSEEMAANSYFSHTSLDGRTSRQRIEQTGYPGIHALGENIAGGQASAQAVVNSWMQSAGHCENIMHPAFHAIGVGYAFNPLSAYQHYWTQDFGG